MDTNVSFKNLNIPVNEDSLFDSKANPKIALHLPDLVKPLRIDQIGSEEAFGGGSADAIVRLSRNLSPAVIQAQLLPFQTFNEVRLVPLPPTSYGVPATGCIIMESQGALAGIRMCIAALGLGRTDVTDVAIWICQGETYVCLERRFDDLEEAKAAARLEGQHFVWDYNAHRPVAVSTISRVSDTNNSV